LLLRLERPDFLKIYEIYRAWIVAEENLINSRLTWLLNTQSILLALLAGLYAAKRDCNLIFYLFPILGVVITTYIFSSVRAAFIHIDKVHERYNDNIEHDQILPKILGDIHTNKDGKVGAYFLPILFIVLWISIIILKIVNYI
jgi:hypothetical protein